MKKDGDKKVVFSTRISLNRKKALAHISVDYEKSLGELIEEGIDLVIKNYSKKSGQ
jgi:hypothetical protein